MIIEGKEAFEIGTEIYRNRNLILQYSRKIWKLLTDGYLRLLVFGPGGTGKTTLGRVLEGDFDPSRTEYEESLALENFSVPGDVFGTILVPPGQEVRQERHWPELYDLLRDGESGGIINVVAYGYHSVKEFDYENTKFFQEGMSKDDFLEAHLEGSRAREVDVIETLCPRLKDAPGDLWMITLVTKQDLWWDRRSEVEAWYREGPYDSVIRDIARSRGRQNFSHEYLSSSLVIHNLVDGKGETLASTVSGYGEPEKYAHLQRLEQAIVDFATA
jgi:hypothetical protein